MDHNQERRHLAQADRHIAQAKGYVVRQRLIIDRLAARGLSTDDAYLTLAAFEGTLQAFERHRATILSSLRSDRESHPEAVAGASPAYRSVTPDASINARR